MPRPRRPPPRAPARRPSPASPTPVRPRTTPSLRCSAASRGGPAQRRSGPRWSSATPSTCAPTQAWPADALSPHRAVTACSISAWRAARCRLAGHRRQAPRGGRGVGLLRQRRVAQVGRPAGVQQHGLAEGGEARCRRPRRRPEAGQAPPWASPTEAGRGKVQAPAMHGHVAQRRAPVVLVLPVPAVGRVKLLGLLHLMGGGVGRGEVAEQGVG